MTRSGTSMGDAEAYLECIKDALKSLTNAAEQCDSILCNTSDGDIVSRSANQAARDALVLEAHRFLQAAQGPVNAAAICYEKTAHLASVRALLEMGAFEALPVGGEQSRTTAELAEQLNVEERLLARLLRHASLYGPFDEAGPGRYRHTPFSEAYLLPEVQGMFRFTMDDHILAHIKLHEFLKQNSWKEPSETTNNPYTYAHNTGGKSMFDNLSSMPERLKAFNDGMMLQSMTSLWMIELFQFKEKFSKLRPTSNAVLAVDIGGGKGAAVRRIRDLCGDMEGRYILQEQPHVIDSLGDSLDGIEKMQHDFFSEQPVHGALSYLIRRCLHNWPDNEVIQILKNVAAAMDREKSCLLIEEIIVPTHKAGIEEGWMDMIMMSLGAKQRTLEEWKAVLGAVGLEVKNVYQLPGDCHGLIEVVLS